MDSQFWRYFSSRSPLLPLKSHDSQSSSALDLNSVPYEFTVPGSRSPVFISQALRRSMAEQRAREAGNGLAIRSFSYESALAGKAPVIGGRPHKGNGPVKLQTSRRLSSGELLVTTQDHQRTLEDIREGEYIVGGIEKRGSRASQVRSPTPSVGGPLSPKGPHFRTPSSASSPAGFSPFFNDTHVPLTGAGRVSGIAAQDPATDIWPRSPRPGKVSSTTAMPHERLPYSGLGLAITGSMTALEAEPYRFSRSSANDADAQKSTVQALWKAERARLTAMYGHERHSNRPSSTSRNSRRPSPLSPGPAESCHERHSLSPQILPSSSADTHLEQIMPLESHHSLPEEVCASDEASDYSSLNRSSLLSCEASSSSYTVSTSVVESEPTTRDDVRRIVDDMRSTYLRAIEAKTAEDECIQRPKAAKQRRPSLTINHDNKVSFPKSRRKPKRQSWHSSDFSPSKSDHTSRRATTDTNFGGISRETSTYSSAPEESRSTLERADSLTLGTLMESLESSPRKTRNTSHPSSEESATQDLPARAIV